MIPWSTSQLLGAAPAPGRRQDLAAVLRESPHTTCAQQPANPICLPDKQFHILSRKDFRTTAKTHSLLCLCLVLSPQGHTGWLERGTYPRANPSTWDFLMDMQSVQDTQAKAGQEATQGASAVVPHQSVELVPPAHTVYSSRPIKCHSLHGLFWTLHQVHSGVKV